MYERFCKERFGRIEEALKLNTESTIRIESRVFNGISTAIDELKKGQKALFKLLWVLLSAIVLSCVTVILTRMV